MTQGDIFLFSAAAESWIPMNETQYENEQHLQAALAQYPNLIPGNQINPEAPRQWLLIQRELGIPDEAAGGNRFSLDHLFVDQDAVPTFVECKRASDTRARREVVAQMLDYAANGVEYWPPERLRQAATETAQRSGDDIDELVSDLIAAADESEIDAFWEQVEANLRQGRIRLVFVADQIHSQLRRLVEFLNEKLFDIEVLAVEIKQYEGQGQKALVPRVIGLTEATRKSRRTPAGTGTTDLETFLAACTPGTASYFRWLSEEAERQGMVFYWGTKGFSIRAQLHQRLATFVKCFPPDRFEIYFDKFFDRSEAELQPLRKRLLTFSSLKPAGSSGKVIRATVTGANDQEMRQVFQLMVEQMRHFQSGA